MHMSVRAAIAGASGYAGGEILRILSGHPDIDVTTVTGASSVGEQLAPHHPHLASLGHMRIKATTTETLRNHDIVFLALPHGHSGAIGDELAEISPGTIVVDCAADHRLTKQDEWDKYYGGPFSTPWTYGMPELIHRGEKRATYQRRQLAQTHRIAVPGCNATAVTLALQPAVAANLVNVNHINATLAVGYSGAGKKAAPHLLAAHALSNIAPYSVGGVHRHIPEIIQNFAVAASPEQVHDIALTFTPVLVPTSRGILATIVTPLSGPCDSDEVERAYACYESEPLIEVLTDGRLPMTQAVLGSGRAQIAPFIDERAQTLTVLVAIDNLGKGTASAAVQCANLSLGLTEMTAVTRDGVMP